MTEKPAEKQGGMDDEYAFNYCLHNIHCQSCDDVVDSCNGI